jgi:hypothetical protein
LRAGSERRAGGDPNASQASSPRRLARRTRARRTPGNTSRPRRCRPSRGRHVSPARGERPHSVQVRFSATVSDSCTREMIAHDVQSVPKRPRTEACNERAYRPSRQRFPCTSATSRHLAAIPARAADFTRNEGVPGSSPGVGSNQVAGLRPAAPVRGRVAAAHLRARAFRPSSTATYTVAAIPKPSNSPHSGLSSNAWPPR